jgi:hypothetical protein
MMSTNNRTAFDWLTLKDFRGMPHEMTEDRELLRWVYEQSRVALFEKTHHAAAAAALKVLSDINHNAGVG